MTVALPPPAIPGLRFLDKLGAGGYADVYLYEQAMPARKVAVKVLREAGQSAGAVARFTAEANAMAQLEHPNIVPVYAAAATADFRPYIVMMYYPKASLAERARRERLAVAEVLRIGIQIGSAVETAHRAGLLHRDIKPANILTSQYGTPGLTDFGIAAQMADAEDEDQGVSVPWSPAEALYASRPATVRSDVYSLAATLWHLLVGRSPFEIPGGDNSTFALMRRIRDNPAPATGRPDVPASLDRLLQSAMSKDPDARPATALNLVRSLQSVEQELRLSRTPIILAEDSTSGIRAAPLATPDATRVRASQVLRSQGDLTAADPRTGQQAPEETAPARHTALPGADRTTRRGDPTAGDPVVDRAETATRVRGPSLAPEPGPPMGSLRSARWGVLALAALVLAATVGVGLSLGSGQRGTVTAPPSAEQTLRAPDVGAEQLPPGPLSFTTEVSGSEVTFEWTYANSLESDSYGWRVDGGEEQLTETPSVKVPRAESGRTCIQVRVLRQDGSHAADAVSHCR